MESNVNITDDKNNRPIFYMLLNAIDEIGPFFQNFFSFKKTETEAIDDIMNYALICEYKDVTVDKIEIRYNIEDIEDLIEDEDFDGYVQNIKNSYPVEE